MIIYKASKREFIEHVDNDSISIVIEKAYREKIGKVSSVEKRAWKNSMLYMYKALNVSEIPNDATIAIEYRIPATSMRIDFIISGVDKEDKQHVVIIELKQWESIEKVEDENAIVKTFINKGIRRTTHPSYQAWTYACAIEDYNEGVEKNKILLHPCAYLHNYIKHEDNDPLVDSCYDEYLEKAPVYTQGEVRKLREFICRYVYKGDEGKGLYSIEGGKIKPSKSLQDALVLMLDGNEEFKLIDAQKVVFERIRKIAMKKIMSGEKNVFIIKGGPGTGKSVLAINLLVKLNSAGYITQYVSKNSAPREVYSLKLKGNYTQKYIGNLFKGSGSYVESRENEIDVLLVDEAHRLNEKSGLFQNKGENQIKEIINASKLSVFFIDEAQKVTLNDIGSVEEIKKYANILGAKVHEDTLTAQFRCNGSDGYLNWLNDVLEIKNVKKLKSESSITIYVPENAKLSRINLDMGAGNVEISNIEAANIDFSFGAGNVNIKNLKSENPIIECGAGQIKFENTELTNAKLSAEVGKVIYSGQLNGESRIECGVGEVEMNLEGGIDNYSIKVKKGIGNIKINKESVNNDSTTGNGQNKIYIDGGVGDIDIKI